MEETTNENVHDLFQFLLDYHNLANARFIFLHACQKRHIGGEIAANSHEVWETTLIQTSFIHDRHAGAVNQLRPTIEAVPPVSIFFFGNHYGIGDCGKLANE
jgi:hypothetical protein